MGLVQNIKLQFIKQDKACVMHGAAMSNMMCMLPMSLAEDQCMGACIRDVTPRC